MENPRIRKRLARERKMRALFLLAVFWAVFLSIYNPFLKDISAVRAFGNTWTQSLDLSGGVTISQEIRYEHDGFKGLEIWLTETAEVNDKLVITLTEKAGGKEIFKDTVNSQAIRKNKKSYRKYFEEQKGSAGKTYLLTIRNTAKEGSGLFVQLDEPDGHAAKAFRGEKEAGGTVMMDTFFCDGTVRRIYLAMWGVIIALSFLSALLAGDSWHRNFLIIGIPLGLSFLLFHTFPHPMDESTHYFRSFAIAEGHWHDETDAKKRIGAELSSNFNKVINTEFSLPNWYANPDIFNEPYEEERAFAENPYMSSVIPIDHAIASAGILAGLALKAPAWGVILLARLADLVFYLALSYYAIRITPYYKSLLFGCALLPACMFLAGSCTQDAVLIGAGLAFIAMMISWIFDEGKKIGIVDMALLAVIFTLIASIKYLIYSPLLLLLLFVPGKKFRFRFGKVVMLISLLAICGICLRYQMDLLEMFPFTENRNGNVNVEEQVAFVLKNPYLTYRNFGGFFLENFIRNMMEFGWYAPATIGYVAGIWVVAGSFFCQDKYEFKNRKKSAIFHTTAMFIVLVIFLLVMGALYVGFTPVGLTTIDGVQNRYLLPVLPLVCITLTKLPVEGKLRHYTSRYAYIMITLGFLGAGYACLFYR
ncbi:MAG: DUF2142 domain-containing protein [Lachnospiraceae bacterium]|nr:DUF2142 domain-containing protein [Lachnospiraceae bacterium]